MSTRKSRAGRRTFSLEQIEQASKDDHRFCLACGAIRDCCEPDTRKYECEACGETQVYGAEELLFMGRVQ